MKVAADTIENKRFYGECNRTKEAWISYVEGPQKFGKEELVADIKGVDIACGDDLYALRNLKVKFKNPAAQKWWSQNLEQSDRRRRDMLADFRIAEQEHFAEVRRNSSHYGCSRRAGLSDD